MAATFGVINNTSLTSPTGGYVFEAEIDKSIDVATVQNGLGNVVIAKPKKLVTITEKIKGKGDPELANCVGGGFTEDTVLIIEAKGTESAEDFPDFEITGRIFSSLA